jgi:sugar lactone lactonase YvrE
MSSSEQITKDQFSFAGYGWGDNMTTNPVAPTATWRFRPSTGRAQIIEASLSQPNGIALSPDEKTLYIGDTGLTVFNGPYDRIPRFTVNSTLPRFLYAFDLAESPDGNYPVNKRPIYMAHEFGTDGMQIAENGYIIGATGTAYVQTKTPRRVLTLRRSD